MQRSSKTSLILLVSLLLLAGCANLHLAGNREDRLERQLVFTIQEHKQDTGVEAFPASSVADEDSESLVRKILKFHGLKKIAQWSIKALGIEAIVAEVRGEKSVDEVVTALKSDGRVESVEPVVTYKVLSYNDPYFHLQNLEKDDDIEQIHHLATGKNVVVGIVDTGVDRRHPELADRIVYSRNFVARDGRFDSDEHGTAVTGVIGARANNHVGIVGLAPEATIMVFKACRQEVRGATCDSVSLTRALIDVLDKRPDIVNLSLAGPRDPLIERLLRAAGNRGMILVGAVDPGREDSFPASMDEVIAVNAPIAGTQGHIPGYGVVAPGIDVLTTTPGATYAFKSGSSMSTAYVSGVAALMKEREPGLSGAEFRRQLQRSSRDRINSLPVVDVCSAVSRRGDGEVCPSSAIVYSDETNH